MKKHPIQHASGSFSRRDFLRVSGITALTVGGMTVLTACGPAAQSSDASASSATTTSAGSDTSSSDSLKLGDGKTLRVGMEAAYAPYNWQESSASDTTIPIENVDGAYADGYDVQVAKKIADALGMEPVAVKMEFGSLVDSLVNGQIDIICAGMSVTDERAQSADFSDSYIDDEVIMVVKQDSPYANATKPRTSRAPRSWVRRTPSTTTSSTRSPTSTTSRRWQPCRWWSTVL